jgi:hypothetical protein
MKGVPTLLTCSSPNVALSVSSSERKFVEPTFNAVMETSAKGLKKDYDSVIHERETVKLIHSLLIS